MPSETAVGKQGIQSEQCAERIPEYGGFIFFQPEFACQKGGQFAVDTLRKTVCLSELPLFVF